MKAKIEWNVNGNEWARKNERKKIAFIVMCVCVYYCRKGARRREGFCQSLIVHCHRRSRSCSRTNTIPTSRERKQTTSIRTKETMLIEIAFALRTLQLYFYLAEKWNACRICLIFIHYVNSNTFEYEYMHNAYSLTDQPELYRTRHTYTYTCRYST